MDCHKPMLPNKPRGVPRLNDRRVLNGIFWILRSGAPWRGLPAAFGPYTTCYNRFVRWRRAGVWGRIIDALAVAHDAAVQNDRYQGPLSPIQLLFQPPYAGLAMSILRMMIRLKT
jgi:transposase